MDSNNNNNEIVISKGKDIILVSSKLAKRGLEIISDLDPRMKHVPRDYPTIAGALEYAVDGDTIELAEGIYHESLQITKSVSIIGASHSRVILEPSDLSPIITFNVTHGISKLKNILFRKASEEDWALGIDAKGESFEFEDCQFEDFCYSNDYLSSIDIDDEFWTDYQPLTALQIGMIGTTAKFLRCTFINCDKGIKINAKSCIDLTNCSFTSGSYPYDTQWSILADNDCRIKSSLCFFSNASIKLGLHSYFESSYDTILDVEGIIVADVSCQAIFSHATYVSRWLLGINFWGRRDFTDLNPIPEWTRGKPKIHFSNSIVLAKDDYDPEVRYTYTGNSVYTYNGASIVNLADEGILSHSDNNLLNIPPHFLCQDPLLIIENNIARLSPNSPAIKSASDGTNLGAWQGD